MSYSDQAYNVCFADEVAKNWEYIEKNHLDGLARAEVLLTAKGEPNKFDKRGKIGLFGRAKWFMDCQSPTVVRMVKPEGQPSGGGDGVPPPHR